MSPGGGGRPLLALVDSCGDFSLQVDLLEVLYHCARAGPLGVFPPSTLVDAVRAAAAAPPGDMLGQLRRALGARNRLLGATAS
jgi:hypothetical protein